MSKIGFLGGCFNPPTLAHFEMVQEALSKFELDKVVVVPMGDKYPKDGLISFEHRFEMLQKMFADQQCVEISRMQASQKETSYAIDTFRKIEEEYPNAQRFFIMGEDNFAKIETWKEGKELVKDRKFIVFERKDKTSSSLIRQKIKTNEKFENLTLPEITNYINQKGLYR